MNKIKSVARYCLVSFLSLLIILQTVKSIGISEPSPHDLELSRGDSARFSFKISAVRSKIKQSCSYFISGLEPLIITFDEERVIVDAGGVKDVYGTFSVPEDAPIKRYNGKLAARCEPLVEGGGSFIQESIDVNFNIDVIGEEGEKVTTTMEEVKPELQEEQKLEKPHLSLIEKSYFLPLFIIPVILIISFYYWFKRKKTIPSTYPLDKQIPSSGISQFFE